MPTPRGRGEIADVVRIKAIDQSGQHCYNTPEHFLKTVCKLDVNRGFYWMAFLFASSRFPNRPRPRRRSRPRPLCTRAVWGDPIDYGFDHNRKNEDENDDEDDWGSRGRELRSKAKLRNLGSNFETNKWQPAQKLGHPAPHATLGRWVKPGAGCPCSRKPTQNLLQSGQGLGGIFPWIRTGQTV